MRNPRAIIAGRGLFSDFSRRDAESPPEALLITHTALLITHTALLITRAVIFMMPAKSIVVRVGKRCRFAYRVLYS